MAGAESYGIVNTASGVAIKVYVTPRASANKVAGVRNGEIKIAVTAPPVEGAANKALVEFLAKLLGVPRRSVSLASGETSRHKVLRVEGIEANEVMLRLAING